MEIIDYVRALRRHWLSVLIPALAGALVGGLLTLVVPKSYTSEAEVLVSMDAQSGLLSDGSAFLQDMTPNFVVLAGSPAVLSPVIKSENLNTTVDKLKKDVVATQNSGTTVINLQVNGPTADEAQRRAAGIALELSKQITGMSPTPSATKGETSTKFVPLTVTPATLPTSPSSPNLPVFVLGGTLLGLLIGAARAVQKESRDMAKRDVVVKA